MKEKNTWKLKKDDDFEQRTKTINNKTYIIYRKLGRGYFGSCLEDNKQSWYFKTLKEVKNWCEEDAKQ